MAKDGRKKRSTRSAAPAVKRAAMRKSTAKSPAKKTKRAAMPTAAAHRAVLNNLTTWAGQHKKAPVCYQPLGNGSCLICYLQSDGSYECQPYDGPVHEPICG
jgi:hypothetical protein